MRNIFVTASASVFIFFSVGAVGTITNGAFYTMECKKPTVQNEKSSLDGFDSFVLSSDYTVDSNLHASVNRRSEKTNPPNYPTTFKGGSVSHSFNELFRY